MRLSPSCRFRILLFTPKRSGWTPSWRQLWIFQISNPLSGRAGGLSYFRIAVAQERTLRLAALSFFGEARVIALLRGQN
jgi:hypothetical protein